MANHLKVVSTDKPIRISSGMILALLEALDYNEFWEEEEKLQGDNRVLVVLGAALDLVDAMGFSNLRTLAKEHPFLELAPAS